MRFQGHFPIFFMLRCLGVFVRINLLLREGDPRLALSIHHLVQVLFFFCSGS